MTEDDYDDVSEYVPTKASLSAAAEREASKDADKRRQFAAAAVLTGPSHLFFDSHGYNNWARNRRFQRAENSL